MQRHRYIRFVALFGVRSGLFGKSDCNSTSKKPRLGFEFWPNEGTYLDGNYFLFYQRSLTILLSFFSLFFHFVFHLISYILVLDLRRIPCYFLRSIEHSDIDINRLSAILKIDKCHRIGPNLVYCYCYRISYRHFNTKRMNDTQTVNIFAYIASTKLFFFG